MAGHSFKTNGIVGFVDYADGYGEATIGKRKYCWEFAEFGGPLFLKVDGEPLKRQPLEKHPVWEEFSKWLKEYRKTHPLVLGDNLVPLIAK